MSACRSVSPATGATLKQRCPLGNRLVDAWNRSAPRANDWSRDRHGLIHQGSDGRRQFGMCLWWHAFERGGFFARVESGLGRRVLPRVNQRPAIERVAPSYIGRESVKIFSKPCDERREQFRRVLTSINRCQKQRRQLTGRRHLGNAVIRLPSVLARQHIDGRVCPTNRPLTALDAHVQRQFGVGNVAERCAWETDCHR